MALKDYFKQIEEFQNGLNSQIAPISQALAGIRSAEDGLKTSIRIPDLQGFRFSLPKESLKAIERFSNMTERVALAFEPLTKGLEGLPPRTKKALLRLAEFGWFVDPEMPVAQTFALDRSLAEGNLANAENELVKYYEQNLDKIQARLLKRCPKRAHIFESAFNAHEREEFVLSIPVFLAQIDGICKERINFCFFRTSNGRPATAKYVDGIPAESYTAAVLSPLAQKIELHAHSDPLTDEPGKFMRHAIMHGNSTDYGTKENSLKAVSLLSYVESMLHLNTAKEKQQEA